MTENTIRQYGLWDSPLSPAALAGDRRLDAAAYDSDGRTLIWLEGRSGRGVLVAQTAADDAPRDLTSDLSVRAEVGYGGGDFTVHAGWIYFVVHKTGRLYRQALAGGTAEPITPPFGQAAAPAVSPDGRWIAYVHHDDRQVDRIAVVDSTGRGWPQVLAEGHDFFMQPRWSPDGRRFAFVAWDHPNMPWDGTGLYVADVVVDEFEREPSSDPDAPSVRVAHHLPRLKHVNRVAGGPDTAIFQPEFTPDGRSLLYVSDETGWGRIYVRDLDAGTTRPITPDGVEHGSPAWVQDQRTYAVTADGLKVVAVQSSQGFHEVRRIEIATGASEPVEALPGYTDVTRIDADPTGDRVVIIGSGPRQPGRVVEHDFASGRTRVVTRSSGETVAEPELSQCEAVSWRTVDGATAHGLYYPPASARFTSAGRPPLVVLVHGGPTSQVRAGWRADAQFLATRGYAVLYVNYRGSTGYGRPYMLGLRGQWGVHDVEDCVSGKNSLAQAGRVDPARTVIMGGSAGGFTVLQTLVERPGEFTAGVSLYGVANQFHLASETHKFEARYLDTMLGPLPEAAGVYRQRSPAFHADRIRAPLAVFQGDIDRVVPKAQSDEIVAALERSGTPHEYHVYEGEGHGWRQRETIEKFYASLEAFLRKYVIFTG